MYAAEFRTYFEHVKGLRFDDRPDYDYLKRLFRELFFRKGFSYDNLFDWELLQTMNSQGNTLTGGAGQGVATSGIRTGPEYALETGELRVDEDGGDGMGMGPPGHYDDEPEGESREMLTTPQMTAGYNAGTRCSCL